MSTNRRPTCDTYSQIPVVSRTLDTLDGPFTIVVDQAGAVVASGWDTAPSLPPTGESANRTMVAGLDAASRAVEAYYLGDYCAPMRIPVHQEGTALQCAVWRTLRTLTPSAIHTYSEVAARAGAPTAVRAVASACARNATGLFVPCHRVRRANGEVGHFAWGSERKAALLARELNRT